MNIQSFDFNVNLLQAVLWEYNDAAHIQSLINSKQDWYTTNQTEFWATWYSDVFNLVTAKEFGLVVWSIILNIPLTIAQPPSGKICFGFGAYRKNFEHGNFTSANSETSLTLEEARTLLRLRYFQLVTNCAVPGVNKFLGYLFGSMKVWALDGFNMTMTYVFNFPISQNLFNAIKKNDVLPRPATVKIKYVLTPNKKFGFGAYRKNFEHGNFVNDENI